ncbi:SAVED domain-containing protein [Bradyrhizobium sp. IC3195]|uniref:dsDNA nuclease domain-containing protein n=1 Tax=Bradyrhizobium sp. IC3195 TaxID=2793804 RepID=UPI001CD3BEB6|nr:dsDNA nuclease domain-containing protein [Bradyrhizobium sp. IC3195]MCA1470731.1 SAVED domain-containing protein [Bradyrhizobium sp. IC3195]
MGKTTSGSPDDKGSLLSPEAMGGINAGKGFDFQTRYTVCHLPMWLQDGTFHQLFTEGTGDIDIRYLENGKSRRKHIQTKDHDVAPAEFKEVIATFRGFEADMPGVYQEFRLACPSLSPQMRPVETGLSRLRNAKPFYDDEPSALAQTQHGVDERMRNVGLSDEDIAFIHAKVYIDVGYGYLAHDEKALDHFIGRILDHPEFASKIRAMVLPAYDALLRKIGASKGVVLDKSSLETLLRSAVLTDLSAEASVTLWVHNWTKEAFTPPADYELDWTPLFDRGSRKVPSPNAWTNELVPQLDALRKQIMAAGAVRTIRFRGKCALSTGIALGATFPAVGSWAFEIPQPPAKDFWRSDATPTPGYVLQTEITEADPSGADLVLGLNIRGDGRMDVMRYVESTGQTPNAFVFMAPPSQGAQSIGGDGDAVAMAMAVREELGKLLKVRQLRTTRLFFYGPFALSVFLGQQLTSVGRIQLFEYQDPSYVSSSLLKT